MKTFVFALVLVAGFFTSLSADAKTPVCFEDVRSWEAVRNQIPAIFRSDEIYTTIHTGTVKGGFKILQVGRRIFLEVHVKAIIGRIDEASNLTKVCFDGNQVTVTLENTGKVRVIDIVEGGLMFKGKIFTVTSRTAYEEEMSRIGR